MGSTSIDESKPGAMQSDRQDADSEFEPQPSAHQKKRRSAAITYARNCVALMCLFALLSMGTSAVSRYGVETPEQVVKLPDTVELKDTASIPTDSLDATPEVARQKKGMRKRAHRKVKPHHPDIVNADYKRRLMGKGGRSFGRSGMGGGRSSRSFNLGRTFNPTPTPSASPTRAPAGEPSASPSASPSVSPSAAPSKTPSAAPSTSKAPSNEPSVVPSNSPSVSFQPSLSIAPSSQPSVSARPSTMPSETPSQQPSVSKAPSSQPSKMPSATPSIAPSKQPSQEPSFVFRTFPPTIAPTESRGTPFPTFGRSGSRSGMMGMGMRGRGRSFGSLDQAVFDNQLQDIVDFLPPDFLALFGNN